MAGQVKVSKFRILVVCTGNICRSPLAEKMLQHGLDALSPNTFEIGSAGTEAPVGMYPTREIVELTEARGIEPVFHPARLLNRGLIRHSDLILTMERAQQSVVVRSVPSALRYTFTIRQFARVLNRMPSVSGASVTRRWANVVAFAPRYRRPSHGATDPDDVFDPFGRPREGYERMLRQLEPAVKTILLWEQSQSATRL